MPLTEAQRARNIYARTIRSKAAPADIERARLGLELAKLRQAIRATMPALTEDQRNDLAELLINGSGDAPATR